VNGSPLVQAVQERLRHGGYSELSTPLKVAGVEFAFTGAMHGSGGRSLDLVLLVDTTTGDFGDRDGTRVRHRVEALSRALDITRSRYVVTVILAGAVLAEGVEALSETCRVLQVDSAALDDKGKLANEAAEHQLDDRIRALLPLTLPVPLAGALEGGGPSMEQLVRELPEGTDKALVDAVIAASTAGEKAVTEAAAQMINGAFRSEPGEEKQS